MAENPESPAFSAALGRTAKVHPVLLQFQAKALPSYASQVGEFEWDDLFRFASAKGAVASRIEPTPRTGKSLPMLEFSCPSNEEAEGKYVYRLWLDPAKGYAPACLDTNSQWREKDGTPQDILHERVEWGNYTRVAGGAALPTECVIRHYLQFYVTGNDKSLGPQHSFEAGLVTTRFTNLRVNEALDDALFHITPPPGTQVIDEVRRQAYIVGSAGQELDRFALREREEAPPPAVSAGTAWRTFLWWLAAGAVVAICLVLLYRKQRRKAV